MPSDVVSASDWGYCRRSVQRETDRYKSTRLCTHHLVDDAIRDEERRSIHESLILLCLKGLRQHYVKLRENEKNRKLIDLLDKLEFNQVVIFVKSIPRCTALCKLLTEQNFPAVEIHRGMAQEERFVELIEDIPCNVSVACLRLAWHVTKNSKNSKHVFSSLRICSAEVWTSNVSILYSITIWLKARILTSIEYVHG